MRFFSTLRTKIFGEKSVHTNAEKESENLGDLRMDRVVPVIAGKDSDSVDTIVRETVAAFKNIPVDQVSDDMILGEEGRSIVISLTFVLGGMLSGSVNMTVGDLILQAKRQI